MWIDVDHLVSLVVLSCERITSVAKSIISEVVKLVS